MYNRVRASFEFPETKIRWNLFNDLSDFTPSHNIGPHRGDILTVTRTEGGNAGHLTWWSLVPSFDKTMKLEYSTI
jgi:hypothetical protein